MSFQWIDCSFFLKRNIKNAQVTINLAPMYKLQYLNEEHELKDINFEARITFEKPLMYDQNMGWNWHKSWNIPDITVELLADTPEAQQVAKGIKRLYAEIYIVKPVISKEYSLCIEDLGLEGNTLFSLSNNKAVFSGLKFSATSYNSEGSKFHFLLIIYEKNEFPDDPWKIMLSKISTPVFVDSRKSAREAELIKLKKLSAFVEPFETSLIDKRFVKKESKKLKDYVEEPIENNLQGLFNYFGAANIRNKIKHPLFLAFKFDGCFEIYLNSKLMEGVEVESDVHWIQSSLEDMYKWFQIYKPPGKIQSKKLVLLIRNKVGDKENIKMNYSKKIVDFLETLQNQTIEVCNDETQLNASFRKLAINQATLNTYNLHKQSLIKNHSIIYKSKEMQLKNHIRENSQSDEHSERRQEIMIKEEESVEEERAENPEPSSKEEVEKIPEQEDHEEENESSDESSSPDEPGQQRLNIPLKCQIIIDPVKKKPMKMKDIIKLHQTHKQMGPIKCQKNTSTNDRQLQALNQLMKGEIDEMKKMLSMKRSGMVMDNRNMYGGFGMMQSPIMPVVERQIKTEPTEEYFNSMGFGMDPMMFNFRPPFQ